MKLTSRLSLLYLLLPFALFALGWLRLVIALPILILLIWVFLRAQPSNIGTLKRFNVPTFALIFFWLILSGIGGYAFQNWDHHWRNAVLRDLIHYSFPVYYAHPEQGAIKALVYYIGFWLPAAWVGKAFGWGAANLALFAWSFLGVTLTVFQISARLKTSTRNAALALIFFSGADALGALLFAKEYPALIPPITHLEIWAGGLQYSSFTTQLFWVFNQSVPAWLCLALILNSARLDEKILLGALCFFFAPLAAVGLLPYLLIDSAEELRGGFKKINAATLLTGGLIAAIAYFYFASNNAAQARAFRLPNLQIFFPFFLLEGGALWLLLAPAHWRNPRWALTGGLLFFLPFIQLGNGQDFVMRASIAPLFYLMTFSLEALLQNKLARPLKIAVYALLLIGALTPLYEINRSAYRTAQYYLLDENLRAAPRSAPALSIEKSGAPEAEHLGALTADDIYSLSELKDKLVKNFIANPRKTFFYRWLAK